jgi:hypothetical protein
VASLIKPTKTVSATVVSKRPNLSIFIPLEMGIVSERHPLRSERVKADGVLGNPSRSWHRR